MAIMNRPRILLGRHLHLLLVILLLMPGIASFGVAKTGQFFCDPECLMQQTSCCAMPAAGPSGMHHETPDHPDSSTCCGSQFCTDLSPETSAVAAAAGAGVDIPAMRAIHTSSTGAAPVFPPQISSSPPKPPARTVPINKLTCVYLI